jgi:hypothetical protein
MKFELTKNTITNVNGTKLYQIQALRDIPKYGVKKGDLGGFLEKAENLSQEGDCWVYSDAWVFDNARVSGKAHVSDNARVFDNARVYGNAQVYGNAWVSDKAQVNNKMVISKSTDLIFISGLRFNVTISLTGVNVGCKFYSDLKDFESRYENEGKENSYTEIELNLLHVTIKSMLIFLNY